MPPSKLWLRSRCGMLLVGIRASAAPPPAVFGGTAADGGHVSKDAARKHAAWKFVRGLTRLPPFPRLWFRSSTCTLPPSPPGLPDSVCAFTGGPRFLPPDAGSHSSPALPRSDGISVTSGPLAGRAIDVCPPTHSSCGSPPHFFSISFFPVRWLHCQLPACPDLSASSLKARTKVFRPGPSPEHAGTLTLGMGPQLSQPQGSRQARAPAWAPPPSPAAPRACALPPCLVAWFDG